MNPYHNKRIKHMRKYFLFSMFCNNTVNFLNVFCFIFICYIQKDLFETCFWLKMVKSISFWHRTYNWSYSLSFLKKFKVDIQWVESQQFTIIFCSDTIENISSAYHTNTLKIFSCFDGIRLRRHKFQSMSLRRLINS